MKRCMPDIFNYTDLRAYLADCLAALKAEDAKHSYRYISQKLGLASKSHLKMVVDGSRKLSNRLAARMVRFLDLTPAERRFFHALLRYGQAKSQSDRQAALRDMRRERNFVNVHQMGLDHLDYLSDPLTLALRELVTCADFVEDPDWIVSRLAVKTTPRQVEDAIERLLRGGLLIRDESGILTVATMHQETGDAFKSVALKQFYVNAFKLAADSLKQPAGVRNLGGLTMAISESGYGRIVDSFHAFIDEVRQIVDEDVEADKVYQLVMGLYPMTRENGGEKK